MENQLAISVSDFIVNTKCVWQQRVNKILLIQTNFIQYYNLYIYIILYCVKWTVSVDILCIIVLYGVNSFSCIHYLNKCIKIQGVGGLGIWTDVSPLGIEEMIDG
jgi:hypothetical protein